jgi:hypothetical protein
MPDDHHRALAETLFERNQSREEIKDAIKSEEAPRAAVIENMRRLRTLRLAREAKVNNE